MAWQLFADKMAGFIDERHPMERDQRLRRRVAVASRILTLRACTVEADAAFDPVCFFRSRLGRDGRNAGDRRLVRRAIEDRGGQSSSRTGRSSASSARWRLTRR